MVGEKGRDLNVKRVIVISMFLVGSYDVFTPGLIDLVTQPLAAQHAGEKHNATQGRGVDSFIILTCEAHVSKHAYTHTHTLIQHIIRGSRRSCLMTK